jgi:hypothetical protein
VETQINFAIDGGNEQSGVNLVYRPWGTRTLKIKASTTKEDLPPLRLKTLRTADVAATGMTCGYADEGKSFLCSWGGGHEQGPCIKADDQGGHAESCITLKAGIPSFIFLNIKHLGDELPDSAVLTLQAFDPDNGEIYATMPVTLQKPASLSDDIMRMVQTAPNQWQAKGTHLPEYDPRWWPKANVKYQAAETFPLTIKYERNGLVVNWSDGTPIALIADKTSPSILTLEPTKLEPGGLDFELFDFDKHHFVLRVWFCWLNIRIGFYFNEAVRHEVPDAERFDFLIRKKSGKVMLACTDFHWQEIWGQVTQQPVEAEVGLTLGSFLKVAVDQAGKKLATQPVHKEPYNPIGYVERLADDLAERDRLNQPKVVLARGWQAHVPTLKHVTHDPDLASSDVRLG